MMRTFTRSEEWLERALKIIPLGTQTFSKSITQYPRGISPYFVRRGEGSRIWDVDGNEYLDFVNGLLSVMLGYKDRDVDAAVRAQLENGVLFTLPHTLEVEVAEQIIDMVPCAEAVRFGKNGSDATAGAIRLARAFTRRDRVAVCGYHGWQDWYIGATTRDLGVPAATKSLTHMFAYNEIESLATLLREHPGEFAAVIMEPMNMAEPEAGFLEAVREITAKDGALLIFDEIVTGFRFAPGGAQELFGVTPDLAAMGKGMGNGFPISAVAGRGDVMKLMEEIFFSFTAAGEALSLAAAQVVLAKVRNDGVTEMLARRGRQVIDGVQTLIDKHGIGDFVSLAGHPAWSFLVITDAPPYTPWEMKTLWMQEIMARGVISVGTHNMSYAHSEADVERLLAVYDEVFPILRDVVDNEALKQCLRCDPIQPLFQVR